MRKFSDWKRSVPALIVLAVLLLSVAGGAAYAKYVTDAKLTGTVNITAKLGKVTLKEHKAIPNDDGSYTLGTEEVSENQYNILPGVDIPKDPFVTVDKESPVPAYVFVEVVSQLDGYAITFSVDVYHETDNPDGNWVEVAGAAAKHGGKVYVYTGGTGNPKPVTDDITSPIYLLENNLVIVSQKLNKQDTTDLGLDFYAYMGQIATDGESPSTVYSRITG